MLIRIYLRKYCLQAVGLLHHLADGVGGIIRQGIETALSVLQALHIVQALVWQNLLF